MTTIEPEHKRVAELESYLDEMEIAEDAKSMLALYREMVVEEHSIRARSAMLLNAIKHGAKRLHRIRAEIKSSEAQLKRYSASLKQSAINRELFRENATLVEERLVLERQIRELAFIKKKLGVESHDLTMTIERLEAQKASYSWVRIQEAANNAGMGLDSLLANIKSVIDKVWEEQKRKANLIIFNTINYQELQRQFPNSIYDIDSIRIEHAAAVVQGKAIVRFNTW